MSVFDPVLLVLGKRLGTFLFGFSLGPHPGAQDLLLAVFEGTEPGLAMYKANKDQS